MSTDLLLPRHRSDILHIRAISDELIDSQPDRYQSFESGDYETFFRLMRIDTSKWPKTKTSAWKGKLTSSGGGVVIKRFDQRGMPTAPPYARLENDVLFGDPSKGAKPIHYAYRPGYSTKHLDIHPRQPEYPAGQYDLLEGVDVYFCLEGSLKADSVLSAGHTSFSSTSVTTWESKDLKRLLRLLRGAGTVYVIPDSDFYTSSKFADPETGVQYFNPSVLYYTRLAAQWLADRRVTTKIAIPWTTQTRDGTLDRLGIDDYLFRGYELDDLTLEDPFANALQLKPAMKLTPSEERVLDWLLVHDGNRGAFKVGELARKLDIDRQTVLRAYKRFEQLGFMRVREGRVFELDEHYRTRPHMYVMWELIHGYGDWLRSIRVPLPVRKKLQMNTWPDRGRRVLLPPFEGPPGGFRKR